MDSGRWILVDNRLWIDSESGNENEVITGF